jgi:trans-2,3-dihydro-3-hydroxyanthranilate isomerase
MHPYEILDVFTDTPLQGNALAVFTEAEQLPSRLMQAVARELHLSETVFLLPGDGDCDAQLRIFTPTLELPFAGHPTLGAAFVVGALNELDTVRLRTAAGIIEVRLTRDDTGAIVFGEMDQPIPTVEPFEQPELLLRALGVEGADLPIEVYTNGPSHVLVGLARTAAVEQLTPDHTALAKLGEFGFNTFSASGERAYRTRMFGLAVGEDPATGSAAGPIAVHLLRHGRLGSGETIELRQGVEIHRPSTLYATAVGSCEQLLAVRVGGSAVRVAHGHYHL